jgi:hypothetical protein
LTLKRASGRSIELAGDLRGAFPQLILEELDTCGNGGGRLTLEPGYSRETETLPSELRKNCSIFKSRLMSASAESPTVTYSPLTDLSISSATTCAIMEERAPAQRCPER